MKSQKPPAARAFASVNEVLAHLASLRTPGKRLVTTNGCFDILHAGHVRYLEEAAQLGDILVVGINSDSTVRKLKGPGRPVQAEQDRCLIVASLAMVDCAFIFGEDDPRQFLEVLRPDVHVKGGDYTTDIVERPTVEKYGGVVRVVSYLQDHSTSAILRRMTS